MENKKGLQLTARKMGIIAIAVSTIMIITTAVLFVVFMVTNNKVLVLISSILFVLFIGFVIFALVYGYRKSYTSVVKNLIRKTSENYDRLANLQQHLSHYDQEEDEEFKELNAKIDDINNIFAKTIFTNIDHMYQYLNLEYENVIDKHLITLDSFLKNHKQFILNGEAYRNAFIFFHFDSVNDDDMEDKFYEVLYKNIYNEFKDTNFLAAKDEKRFGYLVFLPSIDSLSYFTEKLTKVTQNSLASDHKAGGALVFECKAAAVIYPYSDIEDIIPDLRYAIRQGKRVNVYTPDRYNKSNIPLYHTSLNHNNISKIYERLVRERVDVDDLGKSKHNFQMTLKSIGDHIGFETVGIAVINPRTGKFMLDYEETRDGYSPVFKDFGEMNPEFVSLLLKYLDPDSSYFFSRRDSINEELGKYLDMYGIKSGCFNVVITERGPRSITYYLNKELSPFIVSAYDRESLVIFSNTVAGFSRQISEEMESHVAIRRYKSVLRLTDNNIYEINRSDFTLTELSDGLKDAVGDYEQGETCYKHLYGLKEPCKDCPLLKNSKKVSTIGKRKYVTSMTLNRKKEEYPALLMSPIDSVGEGASLDRYDPQLLIHSFYGLKERMENLFLLRNRGYVLFISVDNYDELLAKYGEEGYQNRLRYFFMNYRKHKKFGEGEIYVYKHDTFAVVLPEEGRVDILNRSESIYDVSTMKYDEKDAEELPLMCTYIGFEYPASYNNTQEFFRNVDKYYKDNVSLLHKENFILPDTNYVRGVSREKFILSLLDAGIKNESLSLKYLPEVKWPANQIIGAEILLRLTDKYRNEVLSPFEFIPVASRNNKIGTITNYLIARVGEMYQKYGLTSFKLAGLRSISLNIDTTYFDDQNFLKQIESLITQFHFPKNFLRFEFNEKDIADHYELMKTAAKTLTNLDIYLTVDGYTGAFISIDKLKALGFSNIKISRQLIVDFTRDQSKIAGVRSMVNSIKEYGLSYCYVGVEDKLQSQMLTEISEDYIAQGYFFYEPMDIDVLLDKLRISVNL